MKDRLICAGRSAYYATTEPLRLWWERQKHDDGEWHKRTKVSVYIPTHNRAELLVERALKSVFAQTHEPFEVIVAAHGCTDRTAEMALSAWITSKSKSGFKILQVPRTQTYPPTAVNHWLAGPVVPANAALAECRGDFIARIDDDDLWTPDHIETLLKFAQAGNYEFVSGGHVTKRKDKYALDTGYDVAAPYIVGNQCVGGVQTWLYRNYLRFMRFNQDCWRKRLDRVNDTDLQQRFYNAGVRMGYLDEVVAFILPRPGEAKVGLMAYLEDAVNKERQFAFTA